jgi:hypothetical protein
MSDYKIALLAKWFGYSGQIAYRKDDPQFSQLCHLREISHKAYLDGGRFTEGSTAAAAAVIRFVLEMEEPI